MQINDATGVITVVYNRANVGNAIAADASLTLSPYIAVGAADGTTFTALATAFAAAAAPAVGNLDWACSSTTSLTAAARGMAAAAAGTLDARFAPAECR